MSLTSKDVSLSLENNDQPLPRRRRPLDPDGDVGFLDHARIANTQSRHETLPSGASDDETSSRPVVSNPPKTAATQQPPLIAVVVEPTNSEEPTRNPDKGAIAPQFPPKSGPKDRKPHVRADAALKDKTSSSFMASHYMTQPTTDLLDVDRSQQDIDRLFAERLQAELDNEQLSGISFSATNPDTVETSTTEKAFDFAQRIIESFDQMVQALLVEFPMTTEDSEVLIHPAFDMSLVNTDDMVFQAERVFATQEAFAADGKSVDVDTGYHYTHGANIPSIKRSGLLSHRERTDNASPSANANGRLFGDGIYTANNPFSYHQFGGSDQGLIVARLKGNIDISESTSTQNLESTADTVIGRSGSTDETCVLRSGFQCLALVQFSASVINLDKDNAIGNRVICEAQRRLQTIVDETFNKGRPATKLQFVKATKVAVRALVTPVQVMRSKVLLYHNSLVEIVYYEAPIFATVVDRHDGRPLTIDATQNPHPFLLRFPQLKEDKTPCDFLFERWLPEMLCLAPLPPDTSSPGQGTVTDKSKTKPKFLYPCGRSIDISFARKGNKKDVFKWSEIFDNMPILMRLRKYALDHTCRCKACKQMHRGLPSSTGVGVMPTGSMRIDAFPRYKCSGFDVGTYVISYRFNEGTQSQYHPNPNQKYTASYRVCFLPMTIEGAKLLGRLKSAFTLGLITKIGLSKTTGCDNSVVWSTIPHKTKTSQGKFGFPDATYFQKANHALDSLKVPRAEEVPLVLATAMDVA